jgi:hypothetical protein
LPCEFLEGAVKGELGVNTTVKGKSQQGDPVQIEGFQFLNHQAYPVFIDEFEEIIATEAVDHMRKLVSRDMKLSCKLILEGGCHCRFIGRQSLPAPVMYYQER